MSAAYDIEAGESILFVPKTNLLMFAQKGDTDDVVMDTIGTNILKLLREEELGTASKYHTYLQTLPKDFSEFPLLFSQETLSHLEGTQVHE